MMQARQEDIRRKRLLYRGAHRGCKETDALLGRFAGAILDGMTEAELDAYAQFLDEADADIWDWATGKPAPPEKEAPYAFILATLRAR